MDIKKPIFIVGSGRSGTTVFYNFLSTHPDVCWFSNYSDRFLNVNMIPLIHKVLDLKTLGPKIKKGILSKRKWWLKPAEAERIYHNYCGFIHSTKSSYEDLTIEAERKLKKQIIKHLILTNKKRFLNKQTANNQRIKLIDKMFKDAFYIHIIRDGRAVANSMLNVRWWNNTDIWWLGEKAYKWEKCRPKIELCGLHWKRDVEEIINNKMLFKDRYIEIKYEDFITDVRGTMRLVAAFCGLSQSEAFYSLLPKKLPDMNFKWIKNLKKEDIKLLEETLNPFLNELGYVK